MVNLRIVLGFAFLPAGLKKVLGQPFTDPDVVGVFHDYLRAFHATGGFYRFVGAVQIAVALLLMTQRFASLGALLALVVFTAIAALCWSTGAWFTAVMVTLMMAAAGLLLAWDPAAWWGLLRRVPPPEAPTETRVDEALWARAGAAVAAGYGLSSALLGGVYRPRGFEPTSLGFWVLPALLVIPLATWWLERRR